MEKEGDEEGYLRVKMKVLWPLLLATLLTLLSLVAHFTSPSTFHLSEGFWWKAMQSNQTWDVARVRPFTTHTVLRLHENLGIPLKGAIFGLQFVLMWFACGAMYFYLTQLGLSPGYALLGEALFGFSLPVFMAHFEPVWTWSDFWVYLSLLLALGLTLRSCYGLASLAFTWAVLAHELSLSYWPAWVLLMRRQKGSFRQVIGWIVLPLLLFLAVRLALFGFLVGHRVVMLGFNFEFGLRTRDTIFSLLMSCGFLWIIGLYQTLRNEPKTLRHCDIIRAGAWMTTILYVSLTLFTAHARETRLFWPPAFFLIPLVLVYIQRHETRIREMWNRVGPIKLTLFALVLWVLGIFVARWIFPVFEYRRWKDGNWMFAGFHLAATLLLVMLEIGRKRQRQSYNPL